jgi:hypothetical protein
MDPVRAYVNHGRWIAACECNGAERVYPGELFICGSEHPNEFLTQRALRKIGIKTLSPDLQAVAREVEWPAEKEQIEALLAERPDVTTRNWAAGESLEYLRRENDLHLGELR